MTLHHARRKFSLCIEFMPPVDFTRRNISFILKGRRGSG